MLRKLVYGYFILLGLLAAAIHSQFVQMPTLFNVLWWLALLFALLLAIPMIIYSLYSRDKVLWLLVSISVIYGGLVLPPLMGFYPPILPRSAFKLLDWMYIALAIGIPSVFFYKRRKHFKN